MNNFCIQTQKSSDGWFFHPEHRQLEGIRLTHQPSPWMRDYGRFIVMPQNFLRYTVKMQVVPIDRCAIFEIEWEHKEIPRFAFLPFEYETEFKLDAENKSLVGYTKALSGGASDDFRIYYCMTFNQEIDLENTVITQADGIYQQGLLGKGLGLGVNIAFKIPEKESLQVKLGTSFISPRQAKINLQREVGKKA